MKLSFPIQFMKESGYSAFIPATVNLTANAALVTLGAATTAVVSLVALKYFGFAASVTIPTIATFTAVVLVGTTATAFGILTCAHLINGLSKSLGQR